jgi:hypothetical protein
MKAGMNQGVCLWNPIYEGVFHRENLWFNHRSLEMYA